MGIDIDFSALRSANPFEGYAQAEQLGQQRRQQQARQAAGNIFATDPDQAAQIMLDAGDWEGGLTARKYAKEERQDKARATAAAKYVAGDSKGAQADAVAAGDFDLAKSIASMGEEQRKVAKANAEDMAAVGAGVAQLPYEQRRAAIQRLRPGLVARGIDAATIDAFDPTDANIAAFTNQALGVKGMLEQRDREADNTRADSQAEETRRHNKATEANAGGQLAVARGNLGVRQQEFQARKAAGGFGTPGVGSVSPTLPGSPDDWEIHPAGGQ